MASLWLLCVAVRGCGVGAEPAGEVAEATSEFRVQSSEFRVQSSEFNSKFNPGILRFLLPPLRTPELRCCSQAAHAKDQKKIII